MKLVATVALVLALGVASRVLADRLRIPSVLFLIVAGIVIGPAVLGFVSRETFGGGLSAMVGVSVAIILFEGGYHLNLETPGESRRTDTPRHRRRGDHLAQDGRRRRRLPRDEPRGWLVGRRAVDRDRPDRDRTDPAGRHRAGSRCSRPRGRG